MPEEVVKLKKHETVGTDGGHGQDCSEPQMASAVSAVSARYNHLPRVRQCLVTIDTLSS